MSLATWVVESLPCPPPGHATPYANPMSRVWYHLGVTILELEEVWTPAQLVQVGHLSAYVGELGLVGSLLDSTEWQA